MTTIRSYTELIQVSKFIDRFNYLALHGSVGRSTFGFDRYLNQGFYASTQWRNLRYHVIARDSGCDLGVDGHAIHDRVYIHHMNPMTVDDIVDGNERILDPEFLITVTHNTHNAIHYGNSGLLHTPFVERRRSDTKLW
jgi:hypothetical protein